MRGRAAMLAAGATAAAFAFAGCGAEQIVLKSHAQATGPMTLVDRPLDAFRRSHDPVGEALAQARCYGLQQVAEQDREYGGDAVPPSAREWQAYLMDELEWYLPPSDARRIAARVDRFNDATELSTISPRAARAYVEVCVRGR